MRILNRRIRFVVVAALAFASIVASSRAQQPAVTQPTRDDRIALYQALLDLTNPWTVMCVAAHPDDEDGTSLVVMRRKYGAHTVSLFSTFGEGGQNAIGPELYEELGAIRARETMAASEIQGSEPYFLGLRDFGFSKSRDETFQKWGQEEALRRMVLQIRKLRPDVIITNHSTTSNDHGHHQATARLVVDAFDAAADPTKFADQLKDGVTTWQVQRLFVRQRGTQATPADAQLVTIDPNERDPVRGTLFAEQALSALQKHATQGPWPKTFAEFTARFRAFSGQGGAAGQMPLIRYRLEREAKGAAPLGKQSPTFYAGLRLPEDFNREIQLPTIGGQPLIEFIDDRTKVLGELVKSASLYYGAPSPLSARASLMRARISTAAGVAAGANFEVETTDPSLVAGTTSAVRITFKNTSTRPLNVFGCSSTVPSLGISDSRRRGQKRHPSIVGSWQISSGASHQEGHPLTIPVTAPVNLPISEHLYQPTALGHEVKTQCTIGLRQGSADRFVISHTRRIGVARSLDIAEISPAPLVIMRPRVGVSSAGTDIFPATPPKVSIKLINHRKQSFKGEVAFGFENRSPETRVRVDLLPEQTTALEVTIPNTEENRAAHLRRPELANSLWFSLRHPGLHENLIKRSVPVVWLDARVAGSVSVGYVRGFDFSLPNALNALGVESKELSVDEVKTSDLSKYSSIIVDNRVYESQPELIAANQKLLDYANAGGNLIVFYHRIDEFNPNPQRNRPQLSPYKLILGNERITDENAPISFLEPEHPLLNSPNKLNQDDFKDWIQERGLYYPREWDPQFKALLQSNDPGEAPLKGGLLVADYGKGHYIYSSMVWYRQLRAGVPGAYRMLANMISYGR
ncbi:MAG TPA: PIG-L family deacetylase [Pyrinomonadaceae bacterium]|nr:PIG-L family deacetylase [Pyrinomonadaceae bacterium]